LREEKRRRLRKDLPLGLSSLLRAKYLRGEYYLKKEHIVDVVSLVLDYLYPEDSLVMQMKVSVLRDLEAERSFIKEEIIRYDSNQGFMTFREYLKLKRRLQSLDKIYSMKLDDIRRLIVNIFEDTELMQKKVSAFQLKQLPLSGDRRFDEPFDSDEW